MSKHKRRAGRFLQKLCISLATLALVMSNLLQLPVAQAAPATPTWTIDSSGTSSYLQGVTYGNGQWVAVGGGTTTTVLTSSDGIHWSLGNTTGVTSSQLHSITYDGTWWMTDSSGQAYSTSDLSLGWSSTASNTSSATDIAACTTCVGQAVMVDGMTLYAYDGSSWSSSGVAASGPNAVTYANGKYVVVGANEVLYSTDGVHWSSVLLSSGDILAAVTYSRGQFVAVGSDQHVTTGVVYTSPDGITWTKQSVNVPIFNSVAGSGNGYVAVGNSGVVYGSPNGVTWSAQNSGTTKNLNAVYYANGRYVAVGDAGTIITLSSNANLANLNLSKGTLSPSFASGTTSYTATVTNSVYTIGITPTTVDSAATVTVNGSVAASGSPSTVNLSVGSNAIPVVVTAQDGTTTKSYTVTVKRAPALSGLSVSQGTISPSLASGATSYTDNVGNSVSSITVTPTVADTGDTVTMSVYDNKNHLISGPTSVKSGTASASIALNVGTMVIQTVVTAQDGTTTNTYTIDVNRGAASSNANLSGLTLSRGSLSQTFASGTTSYTASVANSVSSVAVTPTVSDNTAMVTVDGKSVTNGSASGPITLNVGRNRITIVVTAQSGATQTYTVTVNRNSPIPVPSLSVGTSFAWDGQYGVPYNPLQLQPVYGFGPYTWSVVSGSLPSGLTLSKGGLITGTPTGPDGISTFTVQVQARNGEARRTLSILIKGAPALSIKTGTVLPTGLPDNAFGQTLTATGGNPPYTWSIVKGMLPSGLNLNPSTGVLSGITTDTRPEIVTVEVQDAKGVTQDKQIVIDVLPKDEREIVLETPHLTAENVPAFTASDSGIQTTYMPIWYVMQLLKPLGITSTWNGKNWRMVADSQTDLSNLNAGHGTTIIYLNGTVVQKVDTVAATDPWAGKATTYMPIWYVMQLLKRVGLHSTWNGRAWIVTK